MSNKKKTSAGDSGKRSGPNRSAKGTSEGGGGGLRARLLRTGNKDGNTKKQKASKLAGGGGGGGALSVGGVRVRALPFDWRDEDDAGELSRLLQAQLFAKETDELYSVLRVLLLVADASAASAASASAASAAADGDKQPKESLLCVTVKRGNRVRLQHVAFKFQKAKFSVEHTWRLDDLLRFDVAPGAANCAFVLEFGTGSRDKRKATVFAAHSPDKRNEFFWLLVELCRVHRGGELPRTAVDLDELRRLVADAGDADDELDGDGGDHDAPDVLPATTEKELQALLDAQRIAVDSVGELGPRLGTQQLALQGEAIEALLEVDASAAQLREAMLDARGVVAEIDTWLNDHNQQLNNMLTYIAQIESKNNRMEETSRNQMLLLAEFDMLLDRLAFAKAHSDALEKPDFASKAGLTAAIKAARQLQHSISQLAELSDAQRDMVAVKERAGVFAKLRDGFASETSKHVSRLLSTAGDAMLESKSEKLQWAAHDALHDELAPFEPLVHWLKRADAETFELLRAAYQRVAARVVKNGMRTFFADLRHCIKKERVDHRFMTFDESSKPTGVSNTAATAAALKNGSATAADAFLCALESTVRVVLDEQRFCARFFELSHVPGSTAAAAAASPAAASGGAGASSSSTSTSKAKAAATARTRRPSGAAATPLKAKASPNASEDDASTTSKSAAGTANNSPRRALLPTGEDLPSELETMLHPVFGAVEEEMSTLIELAERNDNLYALSVLVSIERAVKKHELSPAERAGAPASRDSSTLIVHLLGALERCTVQLFNRFIDEQCEAIRQSKDLGKKTGALPPFRRLPPFIDHIEAVLHAGDDDAASTTEGTGASMSMLHSVVTTAYQKLVVTLFRWLESADVDGKQKHLMRIENYYHFWTQCRKRSVRALATYVEQADERLRQCTADFGDYLIRKEFPTFVDYFNGVEQLLESGLEVQFQASYSKGALSKLTAKLPSLDKGVARCRQRIVQHVSDPLLATRLWSAFVAHFVDVSERVAQLVRKCYQTDASPLPPQRVREACDKLKDTGAGASLRDDDSE
jgi:hypothetical protein